MSLAIFPPRIFTIKNQMNRLLILVLSLSYVNIYAQRQVRGFLEIRSQISDIEQYLRYKSGESNTFPIDCPSVYICYEISDITCRDSLLHKILKEDTDGGDVAFVISRYKTEGVEITDPDIEDFVFPSTRIFYYKKNGKYMYQLFEIEGLACDVKLRSHEMGFNEVFMETSPCIIRRDSSYFNTYYFIKYTMIKSIDPSRLP